MTRSQHDQDVRATPVWSATVDPIIWFAEMVQALERGDLERALDCQGELDQLGFTVTFRHRYRDRRSRRATPRLSTSR